MVEGKKEVSKEDSRVVRMLQKETNCMNHEPLVEEIKQLLTNRAWVVLVMHIFREDNGYANWPAHLGEDKKVGVQFSV